jgi:recombinational DNA repair ATPase RecF
MIFKTAMWHYLLDVNNIKAILLLDDIMSELDEANKSKIEKMINLLDTQTIITATHKNEFTAKLIKSSNIISLEKIL